MTEAKYELKNWKKWKRTVQLLEETRDELKDMKKGINIDPSSLPGGGHVSIIQKMNKIIEECEMYDNLITVYNFFINRLEKAMLELLTKEQREVCIIYANNPYNASKRETEAFKHGYSRRSYYRTLRDCIDILNSYLCASKVGTNLALNHQENVL